MSQLANGRGLASAVATDHENDRRLARTGGFGPPSTLAGHEPRRQLSSNGGLGRGGILARPSPFHDIGGQVAAHVAGDQQLLDRLPIGVGRAAPQDAPKARHEPSAAALETGRKVAGRVVVGLARPNGGRGLRRAGRGSPGYRRHDFLWLGVPEGLDLTGRANRLGRLGRLLRFVLELSLIHISEPTRLGMISYAV